MGDNDIEGVWNVNQLDTSGGMIVDASSLTMSNSEFVVYAHDAGSGTTTQGDPGGFTNFQRLTRIWRLDDHLGSKTVDLTFNTVDAGGSALPSWSGNNASDYVLLKRSGTSGSFTVNKNGADNVNTNTNEVTFNSVDLTDAYYYALGTKDWQTAPLPVELISFSGEKLQEGIKLHWVTASEKNSQHFVVQRSQDGKEFQNLSIVPAAGFSMDKIRYFYIDRDPAPGINYYHLKQVDLDGSYEYSGVVTVDLPATGVWEVKTLGNPAKERLTVFVKSAEPGNCRYYMLDQQGNVFKENGSYIRSGTNTLIINLYGLDNGIYFLVVEKDGARKVTRFLKDN